jgi:hypothetical protein
MGRCINCESACDDKYKYCQACSNAWKQKVANASAVSSVAPVVDSGVRVEKKWNDDPIVDALLKINNNLSSIKRSLESIEKRGG